MRQSAVSANSSSTDELLEYLEARVSDIEFLVAGIPHKSNSISSLNQSYSQSSASSLSSTSPSQHTQTPQELAQIAKDSGIEPNLSCIQHALLAEKETSTVINSHESLRELVKLLDTLDLWKFINLDYEKKEKEGDSKEKVTTKPSTSDIQNQSLSCLKEEEEIKLLAKQEKIMAAEKSFQTVEKLISSSPFFQDLSIPSSSSSSSSLARTPFHQLIKLSPANSTISLHPTTPLATFASPETHLTLHSQATILKSLACQVDALAAQSVLLLDRLASTIIAENEAVAHAQADLTSMANKIRMRERIYNAQNLVVTRWKRKVPKGNNSGMELALGVGSENEKEVYESLES